MILKTACPLALILALHGLGACAPGPEHDLLVRGRAWARMDGPGGRRLPRIGRRLGLALIAG